MDTFIWTAGQIIICDVLSAHRGRVFQHLSWYCFGQMPQCWTVFVVICSSRQLHISYIYIGALHTVQLITYLQGTADNKCHTTQSQQQVWPHFGSVWTLWLWFRYTTLCFCKHCLHRLENHFSLLSFSTSTLWFCCPMRPLLPSDTVVYYRQGNKKQKMYPVNWFQSWCSASWLPLCGGACCHRKKDLCVTESSVCISMLMSVYQPYVCVNGLFSLP